RGRAAAHRRRAQAAHLAVGGGLLFPVLARLLLVALRRPEVGAHDICTPKRESHLRMRPFFFFSPPRSFFSRSRSRGNLAQTVSRRCCQRFASFWAVSGSMVGLPEKTASNAVCWSKVCRSGRRSSSVWSFCTRATSRSRSAWRFWTSCNRALAVTSWSVKFWH